MTAFEKVKHLGFDLLAIGIPLSEIREMNVRQLDYWAEMKRANDAMHKKTADEIKQIREGSKNARKRH